MKIFSSTSLSIISIVFLMSMISTCYDGHVFAQSPNNSRASGNNVGNLLKGFLVHNDTLFTISYPSNWAKYTLVLGKYTGLSSTAFVGFYTPSKNSSVVIAMNVIGNKLLTDYVSEEIGQLNTLVGFHLVESTPSTLSGNTGHKIVYTTSTVKNGVVTGETKTMEMITIKDESAYFFVFTAPASEFTTYLPTVQKMADSFKIKEAPNL